MPQVDSPQQRRQQQEQQRKKDTKKRRRRRSDDSDDDDEEEEAEEEDEEDVVKVEEEEDEDEPFELRVGLEYQAVLPKGVLPRPPAAYDPGPMAGAWVPYCCSTSTCLPARVLFETAYFGTGGH